jgi:hypothetical protein
MLSDYPMGLYKPGNGEAGNIDSKVGGTTPLTAKISAAPRVEQ